MRSTANDRKTNDCPVKSTKAAEEQLYTPIIAEPQINNLRLMLTEVILSKRTFVSGDIQQSFIRGELTLRSNPSPFYILFFLKKRYPFRLPSTEKWSLFHISILKNTASFFCKLLQWSHEGCYGRTSAITGRVVNRKQNTWMAVFPALSFASTCEIPTLAWSLIKVPLSGGTSPCLAIKKL